METHPMIRPMNRADGLKFRLNTPKEIGADRSPLHAVHIAIDDPKMRDEQLDKAVNAVIPVALERRQGILVTKHGPQSYTVLVDPSVPCGSILETSLC